MQQQQMKNSDAMDAVSTDSALVYMPVPLRYTIYDRYQHKQSIGLGVTLIIIGILCFILNVVCIGFSATDGDGGEVTYVGHGIWCGAMFVATGILGVGAGVKKTRCLILPFMVMCIVSATATIVLLTVAIYGACSAAKSNSMCGRRNHNYGYGFDHPYYNTPCEDMNSYTAVMAIESSLAVLGLIAGFIAIWGSVLGCGSGVCYSCYSPQTPLIARQPSYFPNGGQIVYFSQSQAGQNIYLAQPKPSYLQGMMAPQYIANYAQPEWTMQTSVNNINDAFIGDEPPQYPATLQVTSAEAQPTDQIKC